MLMQNNSDMTGTHNPRFASVRPCPLDNVLIGNGSLKRTIYYRVLILCFVFLRISHDRVRFIPRQSRYASSVCNS